MKDYNKMFADEYKDIFARQKVFQDQVDQVSKKIAIWCFIPGLISLFFLVYFTYGLSFLGFRWEWVADLYKNIHQDDFVRIFVVLYGTALLVTILGVVHTLIEQVVNKLHKRHIERYRKQLERKANEFATTTYMNDIFSALERKITLDDTFKNTFKKIILNFTWFDNHGFIQNRNNLWLNYYQEDYKKMSLEPLVIRHKESNYNLKRWEYMTNEFIFFFTKVNPNGLVEKNVEFQLVVAN